MASTNPILPEGVVGTEINWKTQLTDEHRQMTVSKILEYMMKYLSDGPQDTAKLKIYASSVEENIFSTATSKTDYWGNIKAKMQMLVSRARQSLPKSSPPGPAYSVEGSLHQVEPKMMLQQQKKLDAINGQLNGHQKAVPDLLSQHMSHSINHSEGTSQAIHSVGDDWKEQLYNKLKNLKNLFLPTLAARYQEIAKTLQKMESIPQQQRTTDYETLQRHLAVHKKAYSLLNFPKDKMSRELLRHLPQFEKFLHNFIQDRSDGLIASSQQKQLPTSDDAQLQSPKQQQRVPDERENRQLQKRRRTESLAWHKEQRALPHHQQSVNLQAHHSSQFNQAINEKQMEAKRAEKGNFLQNNSEGDCLLSNQQLLNSIPVSTPCNSSTDIDMNNLEKSSWNIGHRSPYPFSVDPPTSSVQCLMKEDRSLRHCANTGDVLPEAMCDTQVAKTLPSGLLAESADISGKQGSNSGTGLTGSSGSEEPIQRLIKAARLMSHNAFDACFGDMESVLRMVDRTVGKLAGNGSEFAVGEDLAAASTCCYGLKRDVSSQTKQRNRYATSIPVHFSKSGIISDNVKHVTDPEASPLESSIATHDKKTRSKLNCNLLEEISEINMQLIETVVEIIQHGLSESGEGTVVRCAYTPVAISSKMKSELAMFSVPPIMPLKLLVPVNYPTHSPEILDKFPSEISMGYEDLSTKAKSKLMLNLRILHQPISLMDIARTWDTCARAVISDIAQNLGGGSFSSTYGTWKELCYPKAYCSGA